MFDRNLLKIKSLKERQHDLDISVVKPLVYDAKPECSYKFDHISKYIINAKKGKCPIILMIGAHVIRSGMQKYIIDLMERGYISCIAMNGAGIIHDFEFALIGATTENVARYIHEGQFGLWKETGILNDIIHSSYQKGDKAGIGEAVGKEIQEGVYSYKDISLLAAGYRLQIPVTVHVGIGYDIIHEHPNCDGAATGALSYIDFLKFAGVVQKLENGVLMSFGSGVMAPEIFLKTLSMARNVVHQKGGIIRHFSTLVCDLHDLPNDFTEEPSKNNPSYYFRPWKTLLIRTVAEGGRSFYVKGEHAETIPALWAAINAAE